MKNHRNAVAVLTPSPASFAADADSEKPSPEVRIPAEMRIPDRRGASDRDLDKRDPERSKPSESTIAAANGTMRHVVLLIESSGSYGRGLLRGIAKYNRLHGKWSAFCRNVSSLPLDASSTFIRSSSGRGVGFGIGFVSSLGAMQTETKNCGTF